MDDFLRLEVGVKQSKDLEYWMHGFFDDVDDDCPRDPDDGPLVTS